MSDEFPWREGLYVLQRDTRPLALIKVIKVITNDETFWAWCYFGECRLSRCDTLNLDQVHTTEQTDKP